jgi:ketosteroid isomerase-like protein
MTVARRAAADQMGGVLGEAGDPGTLEAGGAEATSRRFARAILAGDARAAAACFSTAARLLTADGTEVSGRGELTAVLTQVTAAEQGLEIRVGRTVISDRTALCTQFWRRHISGPEPPRFEYATTARLVLAYTGRRWEIVIASPWE